jgi:hypothetical protein
VPRSGLAATVLLSCNGHQSQSAMAPGWLGELFRGVGGVWSQQLRDDGAEFMTNGHIRTGSSGAGLAVSYGRHPRLARRGLPATLGRGVCGLLLLALMSDPRNGADLERPVVGSELGSEC